MDFHCSVWGSNVKENKQTNKQKYKKNDICIALKSTAFEYTSCLIDLINKYIIFRRSW